MGLVLMGNSRKVNKGTSKRIYFLTQYFYPDVASTGQLLTELAEDLAQYGFEINILTAQPSYAKYKQCPNKENYRGIYIYRVRSTHFSKNSKMGRILNMLSFYFSIFFSLLFRPLKSGIFLIVTNPPFLPFMGILLKKLKKKPYILLIHDVYPDIAVKLGYLSPKSIVVRLWDRFNRIAFNNAEKIIVLGNCMKEVIAKKLDKSSQSKDKIEVIPNWADGNKIHPVPKASNWFLEKYELNNKFVVLYSGNLGLFHPLETIIYAADNLKDKDMLFLFIGEGGKKSALQRMVAERELKNVMFLPYQDKEVLAYSLSSGDIAIIAMEKDIKGLGVPSKLYSLLAAGRPILALVEEGSEVDLVVKEANCGFSVRPDDVERITSILEQLFKNTAVLNELSINARRYFDSHFNRSDITKQYFEVISSVFKNAEPI